MEQGESSGSNPTPEIWAKLVPSDSRYSDVELRSDEMVVSSEFKRSSSEKRGWCKITGNSDMCSATMRNTSSSEILVDKTIVRSEDTVVIKCGSEIIPVPGPDEGNLSYTFKVIPTKEHSKNHSQIHLDVENAKCCICLNIWHDVVTAAPCLHNFCNGCFSEWLRRAQQKQSSVLCPHCRAVVQSVGRNPFLRSIEEDILGSDPSLQRPKEEIAQLDSYASIKSPLVISNRTRDCRKRARSPSVGERDDEESEPPCLQCRNEYAGFRCNGNTVHLQCQACSGMMPSRTNITVPQYCLGCDRAFCGAYWHAQTVYRSDSHPMCHHETFKPILERTITRIPFSVHEKNRHEQDITDRCIRQVGRSLQDIISEWVTKFNNREIDRTSLPLRHAEMITARTHTCNDCYDKFVSFLLYWFRISLPKSILPPDALQREDCWYGYACRTQHHNEQHARKRNHVCRPTRGIIYRA